MCVFFMQAILHLKIYSRIDFLKFQNSKILCGSNKNLSHQNNKQINIAARIDIVVEETKQEV